MNKPLAAEGFISYRYKGRYGFIMIGAKDDEDAMNEAKRSDPSAADLEALEVWQDVCYITVKERRRRAEIADL